MTRPLVSVVVPLFNHARYIEAALLSVISQDYRPLELIVIDDGSSDEGAEVARRVLRTEMPGAIVLQRENRGAHNTLNEGLRLARGAVLTVLNSDDRYRPGRLSRCVEVMGRTGAEMLFSEVACIDDAGGVAAEDEDVLAIRGAAARVTKFPTVGFALLKAQLAVSTGNMVFTRRLFDLLGGFRPYRYVHDWDFILRTLPHTEPYFLREVLYDYRVHSGNTFRTLASVQGYETAEVMRNCLWALERRVPDNVWAPSPHNWPGFFEWFMEVWAHDVYMPPGWVERA